MIFLLVADDGVAAKRLGVVLMDGGGGKEDEWLIVGMRPL